MREGRGLAPTCRNIARRRVVQHTRCDEHTEVPLVGFKRARPHRSCCWPLHSRPPPSLWSTNSSGASSKCSARRKCWMLNAPPGAVARAAGCVATWRDMLQHPPRASLRCNVLHWCSQQSAPEAEPVRHSARNRRRCRVQQTTYRRDRATDDSRHATCALIVREYSQVRRGGQAAAGRVL